MKRDFRDAAFSVVHDLMRTDPDVVVLCNDMGAMGLDEIRKEFPERAINVGIAEQNMLRAWEQIKVDICMPNLPVTILGVGAGLSYGPDGPTHHGTEDVALMRVLANMTIYNPADWVCCEAVVRMAYEARTPHYIRLDKEQLPALYKPGHDFSRGLCVFGVHQQDVIFATGIETWRARQMRDRCVVDIYRLKPAPDIYYLSGGQCEVWDEHHPHGGLLSIIAENLCPAAGKILPDKFLMGATVREPIGDKPLAWVDDGYGIPFGGE